MNFELSLLEEYDWDEAFKYAKEGNVSAALGTKDVSIKGISVEDVEEILAQSAGENEDLNWLLVFKTKDGRFCFLSAGCDFTGWDCQSSGHTIVSDSFANLIQMGIGPSSNEFHRLCWREKYIYESIRAT